MKMPRSKAVKREIMMVSLWCVVECQGQENASLAHKKWIMSMGALLFPNLRARYLARWILLLMFSHIALVMFDSTPWILSARCALTLCSHPWHIDGSGLAFHGRGARDFLLDPRIDHAI